MNPATFRCENGKYLGNITDNSIIAFDEVIEETNIAPKRVLQQSCSNKIYLNKFPHFSRLFINYHSIIDCCLIKYHAKQKPLLLYQCTISIPYQYTITRLKETEYKKYIIKWKVMSNKKKLVLAIALVIILIT